MKAQVVLEISEHQLSVMVKAHKCRKQQSAEPVMGVGCADMAESYCKGCCHYVSSEDKWVLLNHLISGFSKGIILPDKQVVEA